MSEKDLQERAGGIRLALFDVDGVFTDGRLYYSDAGTETKAFHTHDGHGIKRLRAAGVGVGIISGRHSEAVERRMTELGVDHIYQGVTDKLAKLHELLATTGIDAEAVAFVGDDEPDLAVMQNVGLAIAVANAQACIRPAAHYITRLPGGAGAVREACDLILAAVDAPASERG